MTSHGHTQEAQGVHSVVVLHIRLTSEKFPVWSWEDCFGNSNWCKNSSKSIKPLWRPPVNKGAAEDGEITKKGADDGSWECSILLKDL